MSRQAASTRSSRLCWMREPAQRAARVRGIVDRVRMVCDRMLLRCYCARARCTGMFCSQPCTRQVQLARLQGERNELALTKQRLEARHPTSTPAHIRIQEKRTACTRIIRRPGPASTVMQNPCTYA